MRAALLRYYPQALELFSGLMVPTTLAFIAAYHTPQALAALSYEAFVAFAHQQGYWNRRVLLDCYTRLQHTPLQASPSTVAVYQDEARLPAQQLGSSSWSTARCSGTLTPSLPSILTRLSSPHCRVRVTSWPRLCWPS